MDIHPCSYGPGNDFSCIPHTSKNIQGFYFVAYLPYPPQVVMRSQNVVRNKIQLILVLLSCLAESVFSEQMALSETM